MIIANVISHFNYRYELRYYPISFFSIALYTLVIVIEYFLRLSTKLIKQNKRIGKFTFSDYKIESSRKNLLI